MWWVLGGWMDNKFVVSQICNVTSLSRAAFIAGSSSFLLYRTASEKSSLMKMLEPFKFLALSRTASLSFSCRNLTTMGRGFSDAAIGFPVPWAQSSSIFSYSFSLSNFLTFSSDSDTFSFPDSHILSCLRLKSCFCKLCRSLSWFCYSSLTKVFILKSSNSFWVISRLTLRS